MNYYLAIDIGASSGRHILSHIENGKIVLEEIYRFENKLVEKNGHLCWQLDVLFNHILKGIKECKNLSKIPVSVSIDTWGVDFVLLDEKDNILGDTVAYRDSRTENMKDLVNAVISEKDLYDRTGIQYQSFNTIYQLMAIKTQNPELLDFAKSFLMLPDYFIFLLTGKKNNEYTNATTSNLVNINSKQWDLDLIDSLGLKRELFENELVAPKTEVGFFSDEIKKEVGFDSKVVLAPSHDTASAFISAPIQDDNSVIISSGTWSLLGVLLDTPITSETGLKANFTNEGGFNYKYRYLKNIIGLWIIQSCKRNWNNKYSFQELEEAVRESKLSEEDWINVNDNRLLAPKNMVETVKALYFEKYNRNLTEIKDIMKCIYVSLATNYANAIKELEIITNKKITSINVIGGGCRDSYLNYLTSKISNLPLMAGPIEGTAIGNLVVQFLNNNEFNDLAECKKAIINSFNLKQYN